MAVHTCPAILRSLRGSRGGQEVAQRLTDFSQCTFSTDANRHVVLVRIYRFIPDQGIYPLYLAEQDTSFIMSQVLHAHTHTQMHTYIHTRKCTHIYTHANAHIYTHTQMHTYIHTRKCTHIYTRTHTYTHMHAHTCIGFP